MTILSAGPGLRGLRISPSGPLLSITLTHALTGALANVPASGTAGVTMTGASYALQNGNTAYIGLWNGTGYLGSLTAVIGASGSVPAFQFGSAGSYQLRLCADAAGLVVLDSKTVIIAAAGGSGSDGTITVSAAHPSATVPSVFGSGPNGEAGSLTNVSTSATGPNISFTYAFRGVAQANQYIGFKNARGVEISRTHFDLATYSPTDYPLPNGAGTYSLFLTDAQSGGTILCETAQFTAYAASSFTVDIALSGFATQPVIYTGLDGAPLVSTSAVTFTPSSGAPSIANVTLPGLQTGDHALRVAASDGTLSTDPQTITVHAV